jgi:hypothetical protein
LNWEEVGEPNIYVILHGSGEMAMPEHRIITTGFVEARERERGEPAEHHLISVLPQVPKTQPTEGRGSAIWSKGG